MSDEFETIQPKAVPLAHSLPANDSIDSTGRYNLKLVIILVIAGIVIGLVFFIAPKYFGGSDRAVLMEDPKPTRQLLPKQLPPYLNAQAEQARKAAQTGLARVVELELKLDAEMSVGEWKQEAFTNAKNLASIGDEYFVEEKYQDAIDKYGEAAKELEALYEEGQKIYVEAMIKGNQSLDLRQQDEAQKYYLIAQSIKPNNPTVREKVKRVELLPKVINAWREAENYLLSQQYNKALEIYNSIVAIDPDTFGLSQAIIQTKKLIKENNLDALLSEGFTKLDEGQLASAESFFKKALGLSPKHEVALAGINQVSQSRTKLRIESLRSKAETAMKQENWQEAQGFYQLILNIDDKLKFAAIGLNQAKRYFAIATKLNNISANRDKLSSPLRYAKAQETLHEARNLSNKGSGLTALINKTTHMLNYYGRPLSVIVKSDNQTLLTISTIGHVGRIEQKIFTLRPGEYTLTGSRDGYHDVRQKIIVQPDIGPITVYCNTRL